MAELTDAEVIAAVRKVLPALEKIANRPPMDWGGLWLVVKPLVIGAVLAGMTYLGISTKNVAVDASDAAKAAATHSEQSSKNSKENGEKLAVVAVETRDTSVAVKEIVPAVVPMDKKKDFAKDGAKEP